MRIPHLKIMFPFSHLYSLKVYAEHYFFQCGIKGLFFIVYSIDIPIFREKWNFVLMNMIISSIPEVVA